MNNNGKGTGLTLLIILIIALLIAFLGVKNMGLLGIGRSTPQQESYVQQAQDAVDAINQRQQQAGQEP